MNLSDVINRGFDKFCGGHCDSIAILDVEGETLQVVPLDKTDMIAPEYMQSKFLAIGSSTIKPSRVRVRIDYLN